MRIPTKDIIATVLVGFIVAPLIGYLIAEETPFIKDSRGMAPHATDGERRPLTRHS
jgi:hypothetical protein